MIKVLLVDDSYIFRKAILNLIAQIDDIKVVAECNNGADVIDYIKNYSPKVILMDYQMPKMDGLESTLQVIEHFPSAVIIGMSNIDNPLIKEKFISNGASAYISKYEICSRSIKEIILNAVSNSAMAE